MAGRTHVQTGGAGAERDWRVNNSPAVNTKATVTRPKVPQSGGPWVRNVLTGFTVTLYNDDTAATAGVVTVAVIDGDSGGTDYLWGPMVVGQPGVAGAGGGIALTGLYEVGTAGRAMTIEFSAAAGAHTRETVWMSGTVEA